MVFEPDDERERLVAQLRRLGARADVVAWVAHPGTDVSALASPLAVPFWDATLRGLPSGPGGEARLPGVVFDLAVQAYLERWRAEVEQQDLFEAAQILARAARDRLDSRSPAGD